MKKYGIFALTLVLTAALFTGCGCTNPDAVTSEPTLMPTTETTHVTTEATTRSTTVPTTEATTSTTRETVDNGNGGLENTTAATGAGETTTR